MIQLTFAKLENFDLPFTVTHVCAGKSAGCRAGPERPAVTGARRTSCTDLRRGGHALIRFSRGGSVLLPALDSYHLQHVALVKLVRTAAGWPKRAGRLRRAPQPAEQFRRLRGRAPAKRAVRLADILYRRLPVYRPTLARTASWYADLSSEGVVGGCAGARPGGGPCRNSWNMLGYTRYGLLMRISKPSSAQTGSPSAPRAGSS
eukprot:g38354.t1